MTEAVILHEDAQPEEATILPQPAQPPQLAQPPQPATEITLPQSEQSSVATTLPQPAQPARLLQPPQLAQPAQPAQLLQPSQPAVEATLPQGTDILAAAKELSEIELAKPGIIVSFADNVKHLKKVGKVFIAIALAVLAILADVLILKLHAANTLEEAPVVQLDQAQIAAAEYQSSTQGQQGTQGFGYSTPPNQGGASGSGAGTNSSTDTETATNTSLGASSSTVTSATQPAWQTLDGARYYVYPDGSKATGTILINGAAVTFDESGKWVSTLLDVPYISQYPELPYGCEVVSVTMMLNYIGINATKYDVASALNYSTDPEQGFTGSLYSTSSNGYGGIVYPKGILPAVLGYQSSAHELTGSSWEDIVAYIDAGKPVCIWVTTPNLDHTVVLTGYSKDLVWYNDPQIAKDTNMDLATFLSYWQQNGTRALSY